jgi:type III pantothenate kinase
VVHVVADLGNSRLKWGLLAADGSLARTVALPVDGPDRWSRALHDWGLAGTASEWAIASVNPPLSGRLMDLLSEQSGAGARLYRSAADVPVAHALESPASTGVDRALAVWGASRVMPPGAGQVVSCGSAITVDWISAEGRWEGGAIAPGLGLSARALHDLTAQLPLVAPEGAPPEAIGSSTVPALRAGLVWGTVGALRELIGRQRAARGEAAWLVWTGGDAGLLAPLVAGQDATIRPDLVLEALAALAFGGESSR